MTKALIQKNLKLSHEFDSYVSKHRGALKSLSGGVRVVLTSSSDSKLSDANISLARNSNSGKFVEARKTDRGWKIKPFTKRR